MGDEDDDLYNFALDGGDYGVGDDDYDDDDDEDDDEDENTFIPTHQPRDPESVGAVSSTKEMSSSILDKAKAMLSKKSAPRKPREARNTDVAEIMAELSSDDEAQHKHQRSTSSVDAPFRFESSTFDLNSDHADDRPTFVQKPKYSPSPLKSDNGMKKVSRASFSGVLQTVPALEDASEDAAPAVDWHIDAPLTATTKGQLSSSHRGFVRSINDLNDVRRDSESTFDFGAIRETGESFTTDGIDAALQDHGALERAAARALIEDEEEPVEERPGESIPPRGYNRENSEQPDSDLSYAALSNDATMRLGSIVEDYNSDRIVHRNNGARNIPETKVMSFQDLQLVIAADDVADDNVDRGGDDDDYSEEYESASPVSVDRVEPQSRSSSLANERRTESEDDALEAPIPARSPSLVFQATAEAKPAEKNDKEHKRSQAKRQRAAREAAQHEVAAEERPAAKAAPTQRTRQVAIFANETFYVEFTVRLGSVSLQSLDSKTRDAFAKQVAAALGVYRGVVAIQGARESLNGNGCVLETRVGVRDGEVARALGAALARAPPLLTHDDEALFSDAEYLAAVVVYDGDERTRYQFADVNRRVASAGKPRRVSALECADPDEDQFATDDRADGLVRTREVATQYCGNHAGVQADLVVPGLDGTAAFQPSPPPRVAAVGYDSTGAYINPRWMPASEPCASTAHSVERKESVVNVSQTQTSGTPPTPVAAGTTDHPCSKTSNKSDTKQADKQPVPDSKNGSSWGQCAWPHPRKPESECKRLANRLTRRYFGWLGGPMPLAPPCFVPSPMMLSAYGYPAAFGPFEGGLLGHHLQEDAIPARDAYVKRRAQLEVLADANARIAMLCPPLTTTSADSHTKVPGATAPQEKNEPPRTKLSPDVKQPGGLVLRSQRHFLQPRASDVAFNLVATQDEFRRQLAGIRQRIVSQRFRVDMATQGVNGVSYQDSAYTQEYLHTHRPAPMPFWEALMRVDSSLGEDQARELAAKEVRDDTCAAGSS